MDDPGLSISGIFTRLCFDFNNEEIVVELPNNAHDVDGVENLNPNDLARIKIDRDCEILFSFTTVLISFSF